MFNFFFFHEDAAPGENYDPIKPYLDLKSTHLKGLSQATIGERVRSKGYHDMFNCLRKRGMSPDSAKPSARIAGRYHLGRWKTAIHK